MACQDGNLSPASERMQRVGTGLGLGLGLGLGAGVGLGAVSDMGALGLGGRSE